MTIDAPLARTGELARRAPAVALLAALVALPLYPKIGLISVPGTYIPVRFDDVIIALVSLVWLASLVAERRRPELPRAVGFAASAWVVATLIGLLVGVLLLQSVVPLTAIAYWAKPIEYLLLGAMAFDMVRSGRLTLRTLLIVVFAAAAAVVGYALLERVGLVPHLPGVVPPAGVVTSTFGDLHELAGYLGIIVLVSIAVAHHANSPAWRAATVVGVIAMASVMYFTAVRSEYLALGVALLMLAVWRPARLMSLLAITVMALLFASPFIAQALGAPPPDLSQYPDDIEDPILNVTARYMDFSFGYSWNERFNEKWPRLFNSALASPLFGLGPSAATEAADGYYLRAFVEAGLVGLAAFLGLLAAILMSLWRRVWRGAASLARSAAVGMIMATLFVGAVGILIDTWVASRVMELYWPLLGATLAGSAAASRQISARVSERSISGRQPVSSASRP